MTTAASKKEQTDLKSTADDIYDEEEELGIYSDEDEGDDLSDNEPPLPDQDTSGRPQSQVSCGTDGCRLCGNENLVSTINYGFGIATLVEFPYHIRLYVSVRELTSIIAITVT